MGKISLFKHFISVGLFAVSLIFVQGCTETSGTLGGAAIGTGAGAGIGYAVGGSGGAALGGVIGGLAGGAIGNHVASQEDHKDCEYCKTTRDHAARDSELELEWQKRDIERQRLELERQRLELEKQRLEMKN